VEIASGTLGNRLELYAIYPANRRRSAWRFRVKVADPHAPGARRYSRRYGLRLTKAPKQSHNPCTHALGALCVAIFERKPYAHVETFHPAFFRGVLFRDAQEFLRKYKGMVEIQGDGGWGGWGVYVRERRNRDPDNRRLWADLRRSGPSRKEESQWTIMAPATSTLNFGEVDSLFTEVLGRGLLGS
jgi:hypothetical protein